MCGITAVVAHGPIDEIVRQEFFKIWRLQSLRGTDASGIFAVVQDRSGDRYIYYTKAAVSSASLAPFVMRDIEKRGLRIVAAIAHARNASKGTPKINANNHPIVRIEKDMVHAIVHNGNVSDMRCGVKYTGTDTEELLCAVMDGDPMSLISLSGTAASAYMAVTNDGAVNLVRFYVGRRLKPLEYTAMPGAILFASDMYSAERRLPDMTACNVLSGDCVSIVPSIQDAAIAMAGKYGYKISIDDGVPVIRKGRDKIDVTSYDVLRSEFKAEIKLDVKRFKLRELQPTAL
jgi:glutamine phosphoribosylpyrophosphate amidotransferase